VFESICREKLAPLTLRITLGLICCYHGFLKIMAAGGTNWYPGLPTGWQLVIAWCEFGGGLAILLGFRCRISVAVVVAVTAGTLGWLQGWGLFRQPVRSLEPTFMVLMIGVALLCLGAGEFSVDRGGFGLAPARMPKRKS
jgi:uncharacterized membrane protein YphA (DoxX/SURF4 family)